MQHNSSAEIHEWENQVEGLLTSLDGIGDALEQDIHLYQELQDNLNELMGELDNSQEGRQHLFCCISNQFEQRQAEFDQIQEDMASIINDQEDSIIFLHEQINSIRLETQAEVEELNGMIEQLNQELMQAREAYATLVDLNGDRAQELIETLSEFKQKYSTMVEQRARFLATLDTFMNRAYGHFENEAMQAQTIGEQICGSIYCPQLDEEFVVDNESESGLIA